MSIPYFDYILFILNFILIFIILSQSWNLVLGYTGMVHVGHVAFMAIGAYASALITLSGMPFWFGFIGGTAAATLAGFILALPTVRLREDYIVAATLGIGEITRITLLNERAYTGGSTGLTKIMRPDIFGFSLNDNLSLSILNLIITIIISLFIYRLVKSPFGKVLESIREDEIGAMSLGKNIGLVKLQVLVIAASIAGISGVLYAHTAQFIEPETFNLHQMIFIFLAVVLGGSGTFWGPIVGTIVAYTIYETMRFLPLPPHILGPLRWMLYSGILIAIIIFKPRGIMGERLINKKL